MTTHCLWINLYCWACLLLSQSVLLEADPLGAAPFLLFGLRKEISRLELDGSNFMNYSTAMVGDMSSVVGIDVDIRAGHIYWSDVKSKKSYQADIDQTSITNERVVLENISNQDGVAWDWVNKKLYWTTAGMTGVENSTIEVLDIDTGYRKRLATFEDGTKARAIVLDPIRGWIFWTDFNKTTAKVVRMSMDGSSPTTLLDVSSVKFPNGLSLDYDTQTLYWIDAGMDEIGSIGIDGTGKRIIEDLTTYYSVPHPFSLEFYRGQLYYGDWREDSILKLTSLNSNRMVKNVTRFFLDPTTIRVVDIARQPMRTNPCAVNNGGCSHLCLLSATTQSGYSCICPDGIDPSTCNNSTRIGGVPTLTTQSSPPTRTGSDVLPESTSTSSSGSTECQVNSCDNGGTCTKIDISPTVICICKEGFTGHRCSQIIEGGQGARDLGNFSVSGTLFLGVVGGLLGVIVIMTLIIAVIVCTSVKTRQHRNGKRSGSIGGLSDPSPRDSPTHVVVGRLSDHDYISIKSRESPAPRGGIIINIENLGKSALNQYSIQKSDLNNSSSRTNSLILSPPRILEDINGNHSNNNDTTEAVEITIENSGARSVEPDNEMTCNSLSPRSESLL